MAHRRSHASPEVAVFRPGHMMRMKCVPSVIELQHARLRRAFCSDLCGPGDFLRDHRDSRRPVRHCASPQSSTPGCDPRGRMGKPLHAPCIVAFLWIWAMAYRPERGWGFAGAGKDGEETTALRQAL